MRKIFKILNFKFEIEKGFTLISKACKGFTLKSKAFKGFTLIELLVVISILGLLAALLISNVAGVRERARDSQRKSDLQQIKQALRMYKNDFVSYPAGSGGAITGSGWGTEFKSGSTSYMKMLPKDPSSTETADVFYNYTSPWGGSPDDFLLCATLENKSDQDIAKSTTKCSGPAGLYCVCAD